MLDGTDLRHSVLDFVLRDTSLAFWRPLAQGLTWAYGDAYQSVVNDPGVLPEQRPHKLLDDRFYRAEKAFHDAAVAGGLVSSGQKVEVNGWNYTLVRGGGLAMLQHYMQTPDDAARPASFRKNHAALNDFLDRPQLALGDVDPQLFQIAQINGFVIHGPVSKKFSEETQRLGFLHFAVLTKEASAPIVNIPVAEIIAHLEAAAIPDGEQRDVAKPEFKKLRKKKE
jgi:hypothetical protein